MSVDGGEDNLRKALAIYLQQLGDKVYGIDAR
jgi:hypothetical protein